MLIVMLIFMRHPGRNEAHVPDARLEDKVPEKRGSGAILLIVIIAVLLIVIIAVLLIVIIAIILIVIIVLCDLSFEADSLLYFAFVFFPILFVVFHICYVCCNATFPVEWYCLVGFCCCVCAYCVFWFI